MTRGMSNRNATRSAGAAPRFAAQRIAVTKAVIRYVRAHPSNVGHRPRTLLRLTCYQAAARLLRRRAIARLGIAPGSWSTYTGPLPRRSCTLTRSTYPKCWSGSRRCAAARSSTSGQRGHFHDLGDGVRRHVSWP
jgi:hypothetical protein